ncbi:NAD-dependent epimerase/dehydratase family protein [Comamonas terrigena]|uniref:NAD-dependent epimerase/dehydratase family protein n=1 Tax=Comamonas terrigena TaxID=32013 RepID=UPI00244901B1|nr:NAD(P)-dependent oxidoreductase [Comamonas terrigena]MDH1700759.1 NAD(P)-dependent oxidoreductase [Comamonas terrigena]
MKILLTGAGGFVGGHLLQRLMLKYGADNVVVLSSRALEGAQCVTAPDYELSALDKSLFNDVDVLVHAGAYTPKNARQASDLQRCGLNVSVTQELLGFEFLRLKKVIFTSTLDVYASADLISEATPVGPATLYGASKLYCEKMIEAFSVERGISHAILRLGHIYGPGEEAYQKMLPLTIANVVLGHPVQLFGSGEELRSFIYIDDVVTSLINAVTTELASPIVNVVGGSPVSIKNLIEKIIHIAGQAVDVIPQPTTVKGRDFVFDNNLLKRTLLPTEFDFEQGLAVEIDYMKRKLAPASAR